MARTKNSRDSRSSQIRTHPSEAEVFQLLQEAEEQFKECMRLADLADISERGLVSYPRYAWDNPIGLVVTERLNA